MQLNLSPELVLWYLWAGGGHVAAALCSVWAFWKGGTPEKVGAAIIGIAWVISPLAVQFENGYGFALASVDLSAAVALSILALYSRLKWTFFAAALMINSFVGHIAHLFTDYTIYSYQTAVTFWGGWGCIICLAMGVHGHAKAQAAINLQPTT